MSSFWITLLLPDCLVVETKRQKAYGKLYLLEFLLGDEININVHLLIFPSLLNVTYLHEKK